MSEATRSILEGPAHVAILASAGTGKTFALTTRCLALIAAGVAPDRILATTFTRQAAGEIRHRVLARLAAASLDEGAAAMLSEQVGLREAEAAGGAAEGLTLSPGAWRERLVALVRGIDRLNISTLDSFFAKIAGGFALELGGALSWQPADEEMLEQVRDQALSRMLHSADRNAMLSLIRARSAGLVERSVRSELRRAIDESHAAVMGSEREAWDRLQAGATLSESELVGAIEGLRAWATPTTKEGKPRKNWFDAHAAAVAAAEEHRWEEFAGTSLAQRVMHGVEKFDRVEIPAACIAAYAPLIRHASGVMVRRLIARNHATYDLMREFDAALREAKSSLGVLAFDDVPRMLLDASLNDRLATMYYRLDAAISHVMLDEFQDTSIIQWKLIEPLIDEVVSGEGAEPEGYGLEDGAAESSLGAAGSSSGGVRLIAPPKSFLCVGDVKQSLYGWREAEPDLLPAIPKRWPQVEEERLAMNRRSSPVVIEVVNRVFESLDVNEAFRKSGEEADLRAAAAWRGQFDEHRALKRTPGHVVLRVSPGEGDTKERKRALLETTAARIAAIREATPEASIGVLFRSKKHIAWLRHMLAGHGVAASEEGGNPLSDSPRVAEVLSLLTLVDHPSNKAAAHHVLHSPVADAVGLGAGATGGGTAGAGGVRAMSRAVRAELLREGLAVTLRRWATRVAFACDARNRDRLERLVSLAAEFEARGGGGGGGGGGGRSLRTRTFVQFVESRRVEDPNAARVRLMSIHASKGLEFDAVVLPDLDATIAARMPGVLTQRGSIDGPVEFASVAMKRDLIALDSTLAGLYGEWRARIVREEICALYVAMTRAVHSLEMIIEPRKGEELPLSLAGIVRGALAPGVAAAAGAVLCECGDEEWAGVERGTVESGSMSGGTEGIGTVGNGTRGREGSASAGTGATGDDGEVGSEGAGGEGAARHAALAGVKGLNLDWSRRTRFVPVRSPSDREGAARVLVRERRERMRLDPRRVGIAVHAWLASIEWIDGAVVSDEALARVTPAEARLGGEEARGLMRRFREVIADGGMRRVLSVPGGATGATGATGGAGAMFAAYRELPFVVAAGGKSGGLVSGRFDRVVVMSGGGGAAVGGELPLFAEAAEGAAVLARRVEIYDFKVTLGSRGGAARDEGMHEAQLRAYERAAAALFGVTAEQVSARIVRLEMGS